MCVCVLVFGCIDNTCVCLCVLVFGCVDNTALLGRLFAAAHADYGSEYPRIFREYLGRFKDKEATIRAQAVGIGAVIMQRKPRLAEQVVPHMRARLQDPVGVYIISVCV